MTSELTELLRLYEALQECPPQEQAGKQMAFKNAVKSFAAAKKADHWRVTAFVTTQWHIKCLQEDKRKGLDRGAGLSGTSS